MSQRIHLLPEHLIDQIKAGEVIERPAYLLKELIENAIDANASKIDIHIIKNGLELINVIDDGIGMSKEDLKIAFLRHSTSKIKNFDDLYNLTSFGFRGEALASISSVCKIKCSSKRQNESGHQIEFKNSELVGLVPKDIKSNGTSIMITELFHNTPARLKFLSSDQSEKNFIKRILGAFVVSNPNVEFKIRLDQQDILHFKPTSKEERIKESFKSFDSFQSDFININQSYDNIKIDLYLSKKNNARNLSVNKNYIFINNRLVQNNQIHSILTNKLSNQEELYPKYVIQIQTPPEEIDVNVHPNKIQIKFNDNGKVLALLKGITEKHVDSKQNLNINKDNIQGLSSSLSHIENQEYSLSQSVWNISSTPFFLINKSEDIYAIKKSATLKSILIRSVSQNNITTVPLLISEPISVSKQENLIPLCEKFGFELDPLDENTYALRSYPSILADYPYLEILKEIISLIQNDDTLSSLTTKILNHDSQYESLLDANLFSIEDIDLCWNELVKSNNIKRLSEDNLGSLFHE